MWAGAADGQGKIRRGLGGAAHPFEHVLTSPENKQGCQVFTPPPTPTIGPILDMQVSKRKLLLATPPPLRQRFGHFKVRGDMEKVIGIGGVFFRALDPDVF